jgi:hypothetical protein
MRRIFLAVTILLGLSNAGFAQGTSDTPQNQMGAAATVMGQMVLVNWYKASMQIIDDSHAHIHGTMFVGSDIDVIKIDDCQFNAVMSPSKVIAHLDLGVLSTEYRQGADRFGTVITVVGNGKGPAICSTQPSHCGANLTLGPSGMNGAYDGPSAVRALRAVQFLQQTCTPAKLGF